MTLPFILWGDYKETWLIASGDVLRTSLALYIVYVVPAKELSALMVSSRVIPRRTERPLVPPV